MQADIRQFGGMLMLLGFCAIIQPLANLVSAFGPEGANTTDPSEIPFWGMIGAFCLFINGVAAVFTGYLATTNDWSHRYLTSFLIIIIQVSSQPFGDVPRPTELRHDSNLQCLPRLCRPPSFLILRT